MDKIVVGVDGSAGAAAALRWANEEGQRRGIRVVALLAWGYLDQYHPGGGDGFESHYDEAHAARALEVAVEEVVGGGSAIERRLVCDLPAPALVEAAGPDDLLVVGARGLGGFKDLLLGSVSQHCLHHAVSAVAVVREDAADRAVTRVIVGVDGSEASLAALRWAADEAASRGTSLHVVHAWQVPYVGVIPFAGAGGEVGTVERAAQETLDAAVRGVATTAVVTSELVLGSAAYALLDRATYTDMIVVGSRGLGGFMGLLLGSVSQHLARHASGTVVVVRGDR